MRPTLKMLIGVVALTAATYASAEITVYQGDGFRGRGVTSSSGVRDFHNSPLGRLGHSAVVDRGTWQVCDRPNFSGNCVVLQEGSYDSIGDMPLNGGIASVRSVSRNHQYPTIAPPMAQPDRKSTRLNSSHLGISY